MKKKKSRTKHVFFVDCAQSEFQERYKKSKEAEVILFDAVKKSLASREISKDIPSDEIVNMYITRKINSFMVSTKPFFLYIHLRYGINEQTHKTIDRLQFLYPDSNIIIIGKDA